MCTKLVRIFQNLIFFVTWCKNVGGDKINNGSAFTRTKDTTTKEATTTVIESY